MTISEFERTCECKICHQKPGIRILSDGINMENYYYYLECNNNNCTSDIITKKYNICDKNALVDCINEWNQLNMEEENIMKVHGEMTLDAESIKDLKSQLRDDVLNEIKADGLYENEIKCFLSNIDNVRQFSHILKESLEDFLEKHKGDEYNYGDEKVFLKLQTCLNILEM